MSEITEADREAFHADLCRRSLDALHSAEFRAVLDDLKARCAAARRPIPAPVSDVQFDHDNESREGWGNEVVGNIFANG